jgi:hypothetical protein
MFRQITLALIFVLLTFSFADGQKKKTVKQQVAKPQPARIINYIDDKEEYAVYEAVLKEKFQDKLGQLVVVNKEVTGCGSIIDEQVEREFSRNVLEELFRDCYGKKNGNFELLPDYFQTENKIVLIPESELEKFLIPSCEVGWKKFYKKYPNSTGNANFSRIGFDAQRNYAVVNFGSRSACSGGRGQIIFLQKDEGVWRIRKSETTWAT